MTLRDLNIVTVYKALGGELRGRRGRAFWRDGDGFNVSLDPEKGTWFDFRDGRGGGNLDLVMLALNRDRKAALSWLELNCGLDPLRPASLAEHREFVERRRIRFEVSYFAIAVRMIAELALESLSSEDPERAAHTELLAVLRASPVSEYQVWRDHHPQVTAALVHAGRKHAQRVQRMLATYLAGEITTNAA